MFDIGQISTLDSGSLKDLASGVTTLPHPGAIMSRSIGATWDKSM
ncbi:hypothetical protein ACPOL_5728 [Acidisarcina polymorpha]|uniref:Uncharacterized protein n=1 Tax=Acidisarcina polymorpha TaxID=2211140 RepID=A0A2Z5G8E4_9BACT|nr:hypothetical protein ACPOL_5728 [Acidisarcina polymorpha]